MEIYRYLNAGYPAVAIETVEEFRIIEAIALEFWSKEEKRFTREIRVVSSDQVLRKVTMKDNEIQQNAVDNKPHPFHEVFAEASAKDGQILIILDYHRFIQDAVSCRRLKACFDALKVKKPLGSMFILIAPVWSMPAELKHDIPVLQMPLPNRGQLLKALHACRGDSPLDLTGKEEEVLLNHAAGLTLQEAESAFVFSMVGADNKPRKPDPDDVLAKKIQLIQQSGFLSVRPSVPLDQLGGLGQLKRYIERRILPTIEDPQLRVRGLLCAGVSGTGKSLSAKVLAHILGWPLLTANIAQMKGRFQGESEGNMKQMLKTVEAIAPCVVLWDEVEKGVGGYASSAHTDGGTLLGMVGMLLTWLSDHQSAVVSLLTCNNYKALPPELTNAHRMDECFFVDLPTQTEREQIAKIHLKRLGLKETFSWVVSEMTEDWTGAEIEKLIKETAAYTNRKPEGEDFATTKSEIRTFAQINQEEVAKLREWGIKNMRVANTLDVAPSRAATAKSSRVN